jgi:hypothetical protein
MTRATTERRPARSRAAEPPSVIRGCRISGTIGRLGAVQRNRQIRPTPHGDSSRPQLASGSLHSARCKPPLVTGYLSTARLPGVLRHREVLGA